MNGEPLHGNEAVFLCRYHFGQNLKTLRKSKRTRREEQRGEKKTGICVHSNRGGQRWTDAGSKKQWFQGSYIIKDAESSKRLGQKESFLAEKC